MRRLIAVVVAAVVAVLAAALPASADDAIVADQWFAAKAPAALRAHARDVFQDMSADAVSSISIGAAHRVEEFAKPDSTAISAAPLWIASLTSSGALVGTVAIEVTDEQAGDPIFTRSVELATLVEQPSADARIVYDPSLRGWFRVSGDKVTGIDSAAENVLAGTVSLATFQDIRESVAQTGATVSPTHSEQASSSAPHPFRWAAAALCALFAAVGTVIAIRRESGSKPGDVVESHEEPHSIPRVRVIEHPARDEGESK